MEVTKMQLMHGDQQLVEAPCYHIGMGMLFYFRVPSGCNSVYFVSDRDMHMVEYNVNDKDNKDNLPEAVFPCFFKTKKAIYFSNGIAGMDKLCTLKD